MRADESPRREMIALLTRRQSSRGSQPRPTPSGGALRGVALPLLAALLPFALLVAVIACTPQSAAPPATLSMSLPASNGSTHEATASLEDAPEGVRVSIEGTSFAPGTYRVALIAGNCSAGGEVRAPLFPLFAGDAGTVRGQALARGLRLHDLASSHAIQITAEPTGQNVSCAPIPEGD